MTACPACGGTKRVIRQGHAGAHHLRVLTAKGGWRIGRMVGGPRHEPCRACKGTGKLVFVLIR